MEQGKQVIIQDFESIYTNLDDLFNQNCTLENKTRKCRVVISSTDSQICSVHKDFRCIVIIDEADLAKYDPSFLKKFEKQTVTFDNMMTSE